MIDNAKSKIGTGVYNLENYNDEHFASWCKCGHYCSKMVRTYNLPEYKSLVPGFDTMGIKGDGKDDG